MSSSTTDNNNELDGSTNTTTNNTTRSSYQYQYRFDKLKSKLANATGKLYGRQKEESWLTQAFQNCIADQKQEMILVSGPSGIGKTTLCNTLRFTAAKEKGFFVSGKFDESTQAGGHNGNESSSYDVLLTSLTEYVDQVLDVIDPQKFTELKQNVQDAVGNDGMMLTQMIPALNRIIHYNTGGPESEKNKMNITAAVTKKKKSLLLNKSSNYLMYGKRAQTQFRIVFCKLLRSLSIVAPLVWFLDDIHWADTASLEIVQDILHTEPNMPVLLLCAHLCDLNGKPIETENDPNKVCCIACMQMKPFVATIKDLEKEKLTSYDNFRMRFLDLQNFDANDVNELMRILLENEIEHDTMALSEVIVQQTEGNIFHVLQFVRLLLDQGFLRLNDLEKWTWDNHELRNEAGELTSPLRSRSIHEVVDRTLRGLPRLTQEVLKVASCMGDEIDDSALDLVLQAPTAKHLEQAAAEGLLVFVPQNGGYRFAHDWIRQTAYDMTPKRDRDDFHLKIGRKLWKSSSNVAIQKNVFVIVAMLNRGIKIMKEERERYRVAELNLKAAEKAVAASAFPDAARFARKGIHLLGQTKWHDNYELTLNLYSLASEVEVTCGNYDRVVGYIEEIVREAVCLEDKLRAYSALIQSMGQQDNIAEATTVGIDVIGKLGEPIPAKATKASIMKELVRVKVALRGRSNHDILNLPRMKNPIKRTTVRILNLLFLSSYSARSPYTALLVCRSVLITLKHGIHGASAIALAAYGLILCGVGLDVKAGRRYGDVAIALADKVKSREHTPLVHYIVGCGIIHWTCPLADSFDYLTYASRSAMEVGDVEYAALAKLCKSSYSFYCGGKIEDCIEDVQQCINAARLFRKHAVELICRIQLQMLQCYAGLTKNPSRLNGDSVQFNDVMEECVKMNNKSMIAVLFLFSMSLAYDFREFQFAYVMADGNRDLQKSPSATFLTIENRYKEGLISIALARTGHDRRHNRNIGKAMLQKMSKWAKSSPKTCKHKQLLLDAEFRTLQGTKQKDSIYSIYEHAIECAESMNYVNEMALICERYADFKESCGDHEDAMLLFKRSRTAYQAWGAKAKVVQLEQVMSRLYGV